MSIRVLIAEDDLIQASGLAMVLRDKGFSICDGAASALGALRIAEFERPEVIVMDLQLEGRHDGLAAVSALRSVYDFGLVFVTAHATTPAWRSRMIELKPNAILGKPVNPQQFLDAVLGASSGAD